MKAKSLRLLSLILTLCMLLSCGITAFAAETETATTVNTGAQDNVQDGVILHAFCWSYDTIKDNLSAIAEAGYTTIQTSPVQQPKNYGPWNDVTGQYWKLYQPLTYSVATDSWLGTKEDLTELCAEAHKYGIKIICDVVLNHVGNNNNGDLGTLDTALADTLPELYNDYLENYNADSLANLKYLHQYTRNASDSSIQGVTQGYVNNMISLNTGSEYIQNLAIGLLKECVDCGVDGFRFDAAKHIETPDDGEFASDYWPNVLGAASEYAKTTKDGKELYYYGEILNTVGTGRDVASYTKYMSVTDNRESDSVTNYVYKGSALSTKNIMTMVKATGETEDPGYFIHAGAQNTVLWAESHDTYLGNSGSGGVSNTKNLSDEVIAKSWALNASRKDATALYYARPGVLMGEVGSTAWKSTAVSEANKFHNAFVGQNEKIDYSGDLVYNQRGTTGILIVNCNGTNTSVNITGTTMEDGTYIDTITGNTFTVSGGTVTGEIGSTGIAVVYNGTTSPKITVSEESTSFKAETFTFTATVENADTATYVIGEDSANAVSFENSATITVGEGVEYGVKIPVTITATKGEKVATETYYYEKLQPANTGVYVFYDNSKTQYEDVYCYVFDRYNNDDTYSINNQNWPGEKMSYDEASGLHYYEIPDVKGTVTVPDGESTKEVALDMLKDDTTGCIFSNGEGDQYPAQSSKKVLKLQGKNHVLTANNDWGETTIKVGDPYGVLGDTNSDGKINVIDATFIQKKLVGLKDLVAVADKNADVNSDGNIDINDATLIQKYCVGIATGCDIGANRGEIVIPSEPDSTTPTVPDAPDGSSVFYVVAKTPGSTSIFSQGAKMWIYNQDTGEAIETTKQLADTDDQVVYSYAVIPDDWTNLVFYRTVWTTTEFDPSSYLNVFTPSTKRASKDVNAIKMSMSSTKHQWVTGYVPTA